jgi:hypothetical protein
MRSNIKRICVARGAVVTIVDLIQKTGTTHGVSIAIGQQIFTKHGKRGIVMDKAGVKVMFLETFGRQLIREWQRHDKPALRQAWNDFTDGLCKGGIITPKQYDTWLNPFDPDQRAAR